MIEWRDVHLLFAGHWLFAASAVPLLWVVVAVYRRTRPAVSSRTRYVLLALRGLALGLLLALVAEPVLSALTRRAVSPSLDLLLDTSDSMALVEGGRTRLQRAVELLGNGEFRDLLGGWQVRVCGFADQPYPLAADTAGRAATGGHATDIAGALGACCTKQTLDGGGRGAVLVLSDGGHNLGADPVVAAAELRVPVHTLVVGSDTDPADLQVAAVEAPVSVFFGQVLPLTVTVRSWGFRGRAIEVEVYDGDRQLARWPVTLHGDGVDQQVVVELPTAEPGPHILRVQVPVLEGEQATDNNQALVFSRVHRNRLPVLLVATAPGPELAFMRRTLLADSSLVVEQLVGGRSPVRLDAQVLSRPRAIVLVDPGPGLLGGASGEALAEFVRGGGGLLLVTGPKSLRTWVAASPVAGGLPLVLAPGGLAPPQAPLRPHPAAREHPILRYPQEASAAGTSDAAVSWERLPPVAGLPAGARAREGAQVLLTAGEGQPVVAAGRVGQGRVVVAAASGFWRLDLMSSGAGEDPRTVRRLWQSAVKWLALEASEGRVRATAEHPVYRAGARAAIVAEVFDELMRPQPAALVEAALDGEPGPVPLESLGGGRYRGTWLGLAPGEHHFEVRAAAGGTPIGTAEGRFIVEEYSLESMDVRARPGVLAEMARASGGASHLLEDWRELAPRLDVAPRLVDEERRWSLWGHGWTLIAAVGLLSAEWVVRKRRGML